ncbi:MAG: alanyl-tRNA editing protein [Lachnospiraceae bacterium]|nr:alanyl-tRNA editing protein [Lachnospiraceae bacterium]
MIKLYDIDSHIRSFDARVISCSPVPERGIFALELDRTAFFAEGGGQKCDRGTLRAEGNEPIQVEDVQEKEERVLHYVQQEILPGTRVHGELDWEYRFGNMQQHSGEHILSGLLYAKKGYHNVGFHLGEDVTTLDFDGPLTEDELEWLETEGNRVVYRNLPISIDYPDAETLKILDYRSKKELTGAIRIVRVGIGPGEDIRKAIDCCACCAPHVMRTGEIGIIKIIRAENYKGGMRLTILCGERALKDYSCKHRDLYAMASELSTSMDHVPASMQKLKQELTAASGRISDLSKELVELRSEKLKSLATAQRSLCLVEQGQDQTAARNLVNALSPSFEGHVALLLPKEENSWFFIAGSETEDMRKLAASLREIFGARGGGSSAMIQGTITGEEEAVKDHLLNWR